MKNLVVIDSFSAKYIKPCKVLILRKTYRSEDGFLALIVVDHESGEPLCKLSVNIPDVKLEPGYFHLKNWGENEDVLSCLLSNSVVEMTEEITPCGFQEANIVKLGALWYMED